MLIIMNKTAKADNFEIINKFFEHESAKRNGKDIIFIYIALKLYPSATSVMNAFIQSAITDTYAIKNPIYYKTIQASSMMAAAFPNSIVRIWLNVYFCV